ncbi:MAG: hypothetical protein OIF50_06490, partial [Flavobacteriaceae bacterium]|nr:hypothetical protein [Flavobacteriaceae bacterium]
MSIYGQNLNVESISKAKPLKISGAIAANSVFYNSNVENNGRSPFSYFLQGSLNVNFFSFNMPISYSFSNQGSELGYQVPFDFNRLSLHPQYKWITAHIGDVNMTFSPYTLSGHQFTGGGIDLTPPGKLQFSAMAGELLRATPDNAQEETIPAFKRMGYGMKTLYKAEKFQLGLIGFYAKDQMHSIPLIPEEKGVIPKENLVISLEGSYKFLKNLEFKATYASSALTQDLRAEEADKKEGIAALFFNSRASTAYFDAINASIHYRVGKTSMALAYERIDPGYETLGAYYFNNDFENITVNTATVLLKDKVNLNLNLGYQRDNLENQKAQNTGRIVGTINANINASEKLQINGSYSNFRTFTNSRLNQFDNINDDNLLDNQLDTLNYRQLSQNANVNINYVVSKKENLQQNLSLNYALANTANEQGGIVRLGQASTFHNWNTSYTMGLPKKQLQLTAALNATLNTIGKEDATTWGPTISANKRWFENKLNTALAASYNQSSSAMGNSSQVTSLRINASYILLKKHNFSLNGIQLFRNTDKSNSKDLTITFGYNYAFDLSVKDKKKKKIPKSKSKIVKIAYKSHLFEGTPEELLPKLKAIQKENNFKSIMRIPLIRDQVFSLYTNIEQQKETPRVFKQTALNYLKYLYRN